MYLYPEYAWSVRAYSFHLLQVLGGRRPFTASVLNANGQEVCQAGSNLQVPHNIGF